MSALGNKIDELMMPVCNIFEAKVYNDQLCYEVDLELFKDKLDIEIQLRRGLFLVLDFNEERQFYIETEDDKKAIKNELKNLIEDEEVSGSVQIHLDTLGAFNI